MTDLQTHIEFLREIHTLIQRAQRAPDDISREILEYTDEKIQRYIEIFSFDAEHSSEETPYFLLEQGG